MAKNSYGFQSVQGSYSSAGGSFSFGAGTGIEDGGIAVSMDTDKVERKIGADGTIMYVLMAGAGGTARISLQKTSPGNALMSAAYASETADPGSVGQGTLTISGGNTSVNLVGTECSIKRLATANMDKGGAGVEWEIWIGKLSGSL